MQTAKKAGIAAGAAVLAAACAAGFLYWEGTVFDAKFDDFAKQLSESSTEADYAFGAEITDRSLTRRGVALTLRAGDVLLRWTGAVHLGFGFSGDLALDHTFGSAGDLKALGIEGYSDAIHAEARPFSDEVSYRWDMKPFSVTDRESGLTCKLGETRIAHTGALTGSDRQLTADSGGVTCTDGETSLAISSIALKGSGVGLADLKQSLPEGKVDLKLGAIVYRGAGEALTVEKTSIATEAVGHAKDNPRPDAFDLTYVISFDGITVGEKQQLDGWTTRFQLVNATPELIAALSSEQMTGWLEHAFKSEGLQFNLDESTLRIGDAKATLAGHFAWDGKRLGALSVTIDKKIGELAPEWGRDLEAIQKQGLLADSGEAWTSHIEVTSNGIYVQGRRY